MDAFAASANKAAAALGAQTTDYTDASLIYYQQGLSDAEVKARTDVTLKVANVTQEAADTVSSELTAVWNGYKVTADEAELYIDRLAAIATNSASSLGDLATGMSKVASAASTLGVDED
jgi:TP901 family phage tail tape measure protein